MNSNDAAPPRMEAPGPKPWLADLVMLAAIWGASFFLMRISVADFGPFATAAGRVVIAALFLLPLVWWRGLLPELRKHWRATFFVGLLNSAIPFACVAFALLSISTGLSAILNATVPMFGALVAWLWLKDKTTVSRVFGLVLGFAGIALLAWDSATFKSGPSGIAPGWAVLASLLACICYAIAASYTKRYLGGLSPLVTALGSQLGATLGLAVPSVVFWPDHMPGAPAWAALAVAAIMSTSVGYILYFRLIENAGPQRALSVTFLVPVFALFYGVVLLHETVTPWMVFCAAVIVGGTALSTGMLKLPALLRR